MMVYRIAGCRYINDLTGRGAALYGGRWNSKGVHVLYAASSPSLALLEVIAHMGNMPAEVYCILQLEIPFRAPSVSVKDLPANWRRYPAPISLRRIGDAFVRDGKSAVILLPSVIIPEEYNCLINPNHPDFKKIINKGSRAFSVDERLRTKS